MKIICQLNRVFDKFLSICTNLIQIRKRTFGSNKMKIIHNKEQIVARPMILYIQDFPALRLPLIILPNSNKKSKSGFIMPSFGHSRNLGTWIQDLGYYYAPNDYYDILTFIDFTYELNSEFY